MSEALIREAREADAPVILAIINAAAQAYRPVLAAHLWHEPYMSADELAREIAQDVRFWVAQQDARVLAAMGIQDRADVTLIRHAYVAPAAQRKGLGTRLLRHLRGLTGKPVLIGTWAAASWAIDFYRAHGFTVVPRERKDILLAKYWSIPASQAEASVVLADRPGA